MDEEDNEDRIIRERKFKIDFNINFDNIETNIDREIKSIKEETVVEDDALGKFFDPFESEDLNAPGIIHQDGTVTTAPNRDIVSEISIEGERKVNWAIMVSMIVIYSIISILVGNIFDSGVSILILLILAGFGFILGEIWIPDKNMNLLGVTWVIISMKVLYGLSLELRNWGIIEVEGLLIILLCFVCLNLYVAYRHNHDAIAAQSTLVLLAIGSSTGSILGEVGVAFMILISTILLHGLAIHRKSGNLAALGIASSNLWIGMHAITDGFKIGEMVIIKLDSTLLFLLLMMITCLNAAMASKFSKERNWFSEAFKVSGLGEPGLWGVSVSLGMIGALLSVTANREDLGYALGMVTFLSMAFGGSYLSVRGVKNSRIIRPMIYSLPILITLIIFNNQISNYSILDGYDLFTILGSIVTGYILLRDQNNVSDRVLWLGSVVILLLLILLVPSSNSYSGKDSSVLLLILLSILHLSTALLALKRVSPSLAGVTVILPWLWILVYEVIKIILQTILMVNKKSNIEGMINFEIFSLAAYLTLSLVLMIIVNIKLGNTNINLASKFLGVTEISALIKNSEILQLWNVGLWLPIITTITLARLNSFNAFSLLFILSFIIIIHTLTQRFGYRIGSDSNLLFIIISSLIIIQWIHGLDSFIIILICFSIFVITSINDNDAHISSGMILMSMPIMISLSGRKIGFILEETESLPNLETIWIALICTTIIIFIYLFKLNNLERILKPTLASLFLIIITSTFSFQSNIIQAKYASVGLFIFTSIWLVSRGELRSELKTINLRDQRIQLAKEKGMGDIKLVDNNEISSYDPLVESLKEKRKNNREQGEISNLEELYTSDVSHRPTIVLVMLSIIFIISIGVSLINGPNPIILLIIGIFATLLVGIARYRTKSLGINLPHILGMEVPIAISIFGLVMIHNISHIGPLSSNNELFDLAILIILIMELTVISLIYQENLIDRIPVAIDWFIIPLFISRILGAMMNESLPFPLTVDPFIQTNFEEWNLPWLLLEVLLILTLICDFWIVNKREVDASTKNNPNRGMRNMAIVIMSFGPAGMLAVLSTIRQGYRSKQPSSTGVAILGIILVMISFGAWSPEIKIFIPYAALLLGILMLIICIISTKLNREEWTMMATFNAHILIILGLFWTGYYNQIYFSILMILLSTSVWIIGILQLRRILRILGLFDLILAVLFSMIFVNSILNPINLLIILTLLAVELGIVAWLGISNEKELLKD